MSLYKNISYLQCTNKAIRQNMTKVTRSRRRSGWETSWGPRKFRLMTTRSQTGCSQRSFLHLTRSKIFFWSNILRWPKKFKNQKNKKITKNEPPSRINVFLATCLIFCRCLSTFQRAGNQISFKPTQIIPHFKALNALNSKMVSV